MSILSRARSLWWNLARRNDVEAALDEELAVYVDLLIAERQRAGLSAEAARRSALIEIGGLQATAEATRDAWAGNAVVGAFRNARQTVRSLQRAPVYVIAVVSTLAIGIGSATALFTIVKGSLLRPLPSVAEPDRLVTIDPMRGTTALYGFSYPDFEDFRKARSLAGLALFDGTFMSMRDSLGSGRAGVSYVGGEFFSVLGVRPALGRLLDTTDVRPGASNPVVVIGYDLWQTRFAGSRAVIGSRILLDGYPLTIVGVAPKGFLGAMALHRMDVWIPLTTVGAILRSPMHLETRSETVGRLVGRLAPGRTLADARNELTLIADQLALTYPEDHGRSILVSGGAAMTHEERTEASRMPRLLAAAVGLLILIACSNVANLSLIRTAARRRELATRLALGASRSSLLGRLFLESGILTGAAALAGIGLAAIAVRSQRLVGLIVDMEAMDLTLDWRVLALTIGISAIVMLLVAVASAAEVSRVPVESLLRDGGGTARRRKWSQRALVIIQVAASLVLLVSSASVFGAVRRTLANETGIDARGVSMTFLNPHDSGLDSARRAAFYRDVLTQVVAKPSVDGAALASTVPPAQWAQPSRVFRRGEEPPPGVPLARAEHAVRAFVDVVTPGFFGVLRVPLLLGRDFSEGDRENAEAVAVVSKRLADALWPGEDPLGRYVVRPRASGPRPAMRVVGVVADVRFAGMASDPAPTIYIAYRQQSNSGILTLLTRGRGGRAVSDSLVRVIARSIAPESDPGRARLLVDQMRAEFGPQRRATGWLGAFGVMAVLLAALGLYGVVAQDVLQRTRELAVRSALGGSPWTLIRATVRDGAMLTTIGIVGGGAASLVAVRVIRSLFSDLGRIDPITCLLAVGPLIVAAVIAGYLPARRITRLDTVRALRAD